VLVAVSGGADSVALLDMLVQLREERLKLVVAHLNHSLRGADSDADQEFVARLAAGYGLLCVSKRAAVAALAQSSRLSLEDAGRRARYAFFAEAAKAHGATSIALAHHRDDQAETVLIRLLRGAGGGGLSAMSAGSASLLKRPLLQITRSEIERYLKMRGLTHRTDASNADTAILRNSVRHELIPLLRRYNPRITERLAATAEILAADEELLDQLTAAAYARLARIGSSQISFSVEGVAGEPRGLRLRLYRRALLDARGDLQRIALSHLESIDRLLTSERPNTIFKLPGDCFAARSYGTLSFGTLDPLPNESWELAIDGEGSWQLPGGGSLLVQRVPPPGDLDPGDPRVAFLDLERAPFPWLLRGFAPGDRFRPLGMAGRQKVKELFINEKIPAQQRRRIPLLVSSGKIIWVAGLRMGEDARVTAESCAVVRVEIPEITP